MSAPAAGKSEPAAVKPAPVQPQPKPQPVQKPQPQKQQPQKPQKQQPGKQPKPQPKAQPKQQAKAQPAACAEQPQRQWRPAGLASGLVPQKASSNASKELPTGLIAVQQLAQVNTGTGRKAGSGQE